MRFVLFVAAVWSVPVVGFFAAFRVKAGPFCQEEMISAYLISGLLTALLFAAPGSGWKSRWDVVKGIVGWLAFVALCAFVTLPKLFSTICR